MKVVPVGVVAARRYSGPRQRAPSKDVATERLPASTWRFVQMVCGHYTTPEEIERYKVWQPKRGRYFCDKCNHWRDRMPKPKRDPIPEVPLF